ncbi:hypothetical protein [Pedobacter sp. UBA4863]|uniref:hypothetical protein n=1 Tax=Pedobacter sp. UBA4863 TaxID=1947060 RepID=UPI0025EC7FB4|nr:hypothetical protein [Pedobacter sp. UBA4863]
MENRIDIGYKGLFYIDMDFGKVIAHADPSNIIALEKLPLHEIKGTKSYIEINSQSLIEKEDPSNIILFSDMRDHGTHYTMCYHPGYRNWPCELDPPAESSTITIPPLTVLDPEGMAKKYGVSIESLKAMTDLELLNPNYNGFLERVSGKLPEIDINGERFIVDLQNGELRSVEDQKCVLLIKDLEPGFLDNDFSYSFRYDPIKRGVINNDMPVSNKQIIKVALPPTIELDPVWVARSMGLPDKEFIRDYPIKKELKARVERLREAIKKVVHPRRAKRRKL